MHKEGQTIGTTEELQHEEVMSIDMAIDIKKGGSSILLNSEVARISVKENFSPGRNPNNLQSTARIDTKQKLSDSQSCVKKQAMATGYCRVPAINQIDNS